MEEMQTYIGVKMIEATPCPAWKDMGEHKEGDPGYKVRYPDGYESWSPKEVFEASYFPLSKPDSISEEDVEYFVAPYGINTIRLGDKTVVVHVQAETLTGFTVTESSACIDPANYNEEIGKGICLDRIRDQIWGHLGFVLQWAKNGLRQ